MVPEHTNVEFTDEFRVWWDGLDIRDQRAVAKVINALVERGPRLQFPYTSGVKGSRHSHMRELRISGRLPIRIFYAFDPYRTAILLIAGHKTETERFYRDYIPRADTIYDQYLREIEQERRRAITRRGTQR